MHGWSVRLFPFRGRGQEAFRRRASPRGRSCKLLIDLFTHAHIGDDDGITTYALQQILPVLFPERTEDRPALFLPFLLSAHEFGVHPAF